MSAVLCSYCGGRLVTRKSDGKDVHATTASRVPRRMITPGDWVSAGHNLAGTPVGSCDVVRIGQVKRYLIDAVHSYSDNLAGLCLPYSLPAPRGGSWTVRQA